MDAMAEAGRLSAETRSLLSKGNRTPQEDAAMLHRAHAACLLFQTAKQPALNVRAEWLVSRVYSALGVGSLALLHGEISLDICLVNGLDSLDVALAYEAMARAQTLLHAQQEAATMKMQGLKAAGDIADETNRLFVLDALAEITP